MAAKTTSAPTVRPAPHPSDLTAAFWAATTEGRFLIQRCTRCQAAIFYPRINCTECGSTALVNEDASGQGTVYTYTVARRPTRRARAAARAPPPAAGAAPRRKAP